MKLIRKIKTKDKEIKKASTPAFFFFFLQNICVNHFQIFSFFKWLDLHLTISASNHSWAFVASTCFVRSSFFLFFSASWALIKAFVFQSTSYLLQDNFTSLINPWSMLNIVTLPTQLVHLLLSWGWLLYPHKWCIHGFLA